MSMKPPVQGVRRLLHPLVNKIQADLLCMSASRARIERRLGEDNGGDDETCYKMNAIHQMMMAIMMK